jgi:hypothetical protein
VYPGCGGGPASGLVSIAPDVEGAEPVLSFAERVLNGLEKGSSESRVESWLQPETATPISPAARARRHGRERRRSIRIATHSDAKLNPASRL